MKEIIAKKDDYYVEAVNAIIDDEYIIPGMNGMEVNESKSFSNMNKYKLFDEYFLAYDYIKPDVSIENNKELIIKQGNPKKQSVSIILSKDIKLTEKYSVLTNIDNYSIDNNMINNESNKDNFNILNRQLNKDNINNNICIINSNVNISECKNNGYYLVQAKEINSTSYYEIKNNISSGDIYLVKESITSDQLLLFIKEIKRKDLDIIYINDLLSESIN